MPLVHDESNDPGGDITVNAPSSGYSPWVAGAGNFARGVAQGLGKGAESMVPASVEGPERKDWSSSPGEGGAESAGEWTGYIGANVAPFLVGGPVLGAVSKAAKIPGIADTIGSGLGNLALRYRNAQQARALASAYGSAQIAKAAQAGQKGYKAITGTGQVVGRGAEAVAKGGAAGATEAAIRNEDEQDPQRYWSEVFHGGVEGGTTAGLFSQGRLAYEALPQGIKSMIGHGASVVSVGGAGLTIMDRIGHHHWVPWHLIGMATRSLYEMGKQALKIPSKYVGAGSEVIREKGFSLPKRQSNEDTVGKEQPEEKLPQFHSDLENQPDAPQEPDQPDQTDDQNQ